jgi:hypothetical protein
MKLEAQRIAIAEACGWKWDSNYNDPHWHKGTMLARRIQELPDYLSDLNAMHEAEKVLEGLDRHNYGVTLAKLVLNEERAFFGEDPDSEPTLNGLGFFALANLTAPQRAEAFLRTLNLWKD